MWQKGICVNNVYAQGVQGTSYVQINQAPSNSKKLFDLEKVCDLSGELGDNRG